MRFLPALLLVCAAALPATSQTTYVPSAPAGAVDAPQLHLARSGNEVIVTWVLPPLEIKNFEIYRNTHKDTKGRGRAAAVRTEPAIFIDQVADLSVTYWYWLKITLISGQELNIGPVPTPAATVWTP